MLTANAPDATHEFWTSRCFGAWCLLRTAVDVQSLPGTWSRPTNVVCRAKLAVEGQGMFHGIPWTPACG